MELESMSRDIHLIKDDHFESPDNEDTLPVPIKIEHYSLQWSGKRVQCFIEIYHEPDDSIIASDSDGQKSEHYELDCEVDFMQI